MGDHVKRYDVWSGNKHGILEDPTRCIAEVPDGTGWHSYQCQRKRGYGYQGHFCKQHAKKPCSHWDREEINLVMDGTTPPITRCKDCGATVDL